MKCALIGLASVLFLGRVVAQETCPAELKVLLAATAPQPAVSAFGFKKQTSAMVYFFDTDSLDLLQQGVIIRIRQGGNNDLTVKLRPGGETTHLRGRFPCEIDRTPAAEIESYAIGRQYRAASIPETGAEILDLLSDSQKQLLMAGRVAIDWGQVTRIAGIRSTKWQTSRRSAYGGRLALELWEWHGGRILEVSARVSPAQDASEPLALEALLKAKGLAVNAVQDTKTTTALKALTAHSPSPK